MATRRLLAAALVLLAVPVVASCGASFHPLVAAEACRCNPQQYCHVKPAAGGGGRATVECLPFPASCAASPSCGCLGRPIDACREELGAFTLLEPRAVGACDDCSPEEYCWRPRPDAADRMCGLIPARCEDTPTCECLLEARHGLGRLACDDRGGRIQAGPVAAATLTRP
jgi:hypothetical protein